MKHVVVFILFSVLSVATASAQTPEELPGFGPMLRIGAIGAAIGIGIDALLRNTVYETASGSSRLDAGSLLARRGGGVQLSVSF